MSKVNAEMVACPWCGSDEHLVVSTCGSLTSDMPDRPYRVLCTHIDHDTVDGPVAYGRSAAIAAWNHRATPPLPDAGMIEKVANWLCDKAREIEGDSDSPLRVSAANEYCERASELRSLAAIPSCAAMRGALEVLRAIVGNANEAMPLGPFDCIDNHGEAYQSEAFQKALDRGRKLLAALALQPTVSASQAARA